MLSRCMRLLVIFSLLIAASVAIAANTPANLYCQIAGVWKPCPVPLPVLGPQPTNYALESGGNLDKILASLQSIEKTLGQILQNTTAQAQAIGGSSGISSTTGGGTSTPSVTGWQPLLLGGGGFVDGISIANDGTMCVRTDTDGGHCWNASAASPKGNDGTVGAWVQFVNSVSMPSAFVEFTDSNGFQGTYEVQVAPSSSQIVYMIYDGWAFKSTNGGGLWTQLLNFTPQISAAPNDSNGARLNQQRMSIDPQNPNVVFVAGYQDNLRTTPDGGTTWNVIASGTLPASTLSTNAITTIFDPHSAVSGGKTQGIYAAVPGHDIYHSTDGGATWTALSAPINATSQMAINPATGDLFVADGTANLRKWNGSAWSAPLSSSFNPYKIAINPLNCSSGSVCEIAITNIGGSLQVSYDNGATWSGSITQSLQALDVPWLATTSTFMTAGGMQFDPVTNGKLWFTSGVGVWHYQVPSSSPPASFNWVSQTVGIENLVINDIIVAPNGGGTVAPLIAVWDQGTFFQNNLAKYPTNHGFSGIFTPAWALDYATTTDFTVVAADWQGTMFSGSSTTGGNNDWSTFAATIPAFSAAGGGAISTGDSSHTLFTVAGGWQPQYTTNNGTSWNGVDLSAFGVLGNNNISSGTYNTSTGLVTLTLTSSVGSATGAGLSFIVKNLTGTGTNLGSLGGTQTSVSSSGTTLTYTAATGLGTITITGGNINGWQRYGPGADFTRHYPTASDRVTANTYYLWFKDYGVFKSTDGGATWARQNNTTNLCLSGCDQPTANNVRFQSVPGNAGHLFFTCGFCGDPLWRSLDGGVTWCQVGTNCAITSSQVPTSIIAFGFGKAKPGGGGYPAIFIVGNVNSVYGIWRSDDNTATWVNIGTWPMNNFNSPTSMAGDPNIYGRVYIGLSDTAFYRDLNFLLNRDLDPATNDNSPVGLSKAA